MMSSSTAVQRAASLLAARPTRVRLGALCLALWAVVASADPAYLLKPARVFDGVDPKPHEGWSVLVRGDKIEAAGGKLVVPKTMISDEYGYMAVFLDTEGNRIALHSVPEKYLTGNNG